MSMPPVVDSVNTSYHHGHLREALIDAATDLARAGGPEAVGLRSVSRQAGVSHNAAYRHFSDLNDLLRAVCVRAMAELATRLEAGIDRVHRDDPIEEARDRLWACGEAYLRFALEQPGLFRTAFAVPSTMDNLEATEGTSPGGHQPYALLEQQIARLAQLGYVEPGTEDTAALSCWSTVHGLSCLMLDGPLRSLDALGRDEVITSVLNRTTALVTER